MLGWGILIRVDSYNHRGTVWKQHLQHSVSDAIQTPAERLIKQTTSLCPECLAAIPANIVSREGKTYLSKMCSQHGSFEDVFWSSQDLYERARGYAIRGAEPPFRHTYSKNGCPHDCGLCPNHKNHTILAVMDITNLCNAKCPTCFASSDKRKEYV